MVIALMTNTAMACVDYHPVPPIITVKVDSTWTVWEITVHQLNIFAGTTGDFCTCALSAYQNLFSMIYYVAFVDSGTTSPINGFAVWNANANASGAWTTANPGPTWTGFVAAVVNNMTPGLPVELIIRANLPPGYVTFNDIDSTLIWSNLGTDQWDNSLNVLMNTHNSVSGFGNSTYQLVAPEYFTGITDIENNFIVNIFPNPGNGVFSVMMRNDVLNAELEVYNVLGDKIYETPIGKRTILNVSITGQPAGIYFIRLLHEGKVFRTEKLIIID